MENRFVKSTYLVDAAMADGSRRYLSTLLLSIVELDAQHVALLEHCHEQPLSNENLDVLCHLRRLGLARFQDEDEFAGVWQQIEQWRGYQFLSVVLCLTFACNFRCVYCYERPSAPAVPSKQLMSPETASAILGWMNDVMRTRNIDSARITFFGGEPLICYSLIQGVLEQSATLLKCEHLEINMSTNGYLLAPGKIETLHSLGLRRLQLTLDGPSQVHDRRRPLASGRGTFHVITRNLVACLDHGIGVDLLTVCDDDNVGSLFSLVDVLSKLVSDPQMRGAIHWSFTLVEPSESCAGRSAQLLLGKERRLAEAVHEARIYARKAGFNVVFPYSSNICARQLDYTFGIGPQGEIYPCFGVYGNPRYSIGNISESFDTVEQKSKQWARRDCFDEECVSCEVLPLCRGSRCQHMAAQLNGGAFAQKYCEKQLLLEDIKRSLSSSLACSPAP